MLDVWGKEGKERIGGRKYHGEKETSYMRRRERRKRYRSLGFGVRQKDGFKCRFIGSQLYMSLKSGTETHLY